MRQKSYRRIDTLANASLIIGLLTLLVGVSQHSFTATTRRPTSPSSLAERATAINAARQNQQTQYSFTTRFTPGIGVITDPEANRTSWLQSLGLGTTPNYEDVE